jgi:hypothetical protein
MNGGKYIKLKFGLTPRIIFYFFFTEEDFLSVYIKVDQNNLTNYI